jgi:hypothetical protein
LSIATQKTKKGNGKRLRKGMNIFLIGFMNIKKNKRSILPSITAFTSLFCIFLLYCFYFKMVRNLVGGGSNKQKGLNG